MGLSVGIVGLPNVGKSTLFNALSSAKAEAANYPFCTIEPNVGVVSVADSRLGSLDSVVHADRIVPATIDFVDIAGLVRGAHKGEGLGNQFLAHIREVDAVAQVARCFEDANVVHVENRVDPVGDIATVTTELCLKDLETVSKRADRARKLLKTGSAIEKLAGEICDGLAKHLDAGKPARTFRLPDHADAAGIVREMQLLTDKPTFYIANVDEGSLARLDANPHVPALLKPAAESARTKIGPRSTEFPQALMYLAGEAALTGRREEAFVYLGQAVDAGATREDLKTEALLDSLHGEPRFEALVKRAPPEDKP